MIRFWFAPTPDLTIDVRPLALETEPAQTFALAADLVGNLHRVNFGGERYPVAARLLLAAAQLGWGGESTGTLRQRLLSLLETGVPVVVFVEATGLALQLSITSVSPQLLYDEELSEPASRDAVEVRALVLDDGTFADFNELTSVTWRGRNH